MTSSATYRKRLEGVKVTPELQSIFRTCRTRLAEVEPSVGGKSDDGVVQSSTVSKALEKMTWKEAKGAIELRLREEEEASEKGSSCFYTIAVVKAMDTILSSSSSSEADLKQLENALQKTSLVYTPPPPAEITAERKKFLKRMHRLRLRQEEYSYKKITQNLDTTVDDDVTAKSMTYAASVGLNMIVAPISFGVFMYFFAGQIFTRFFDSAELDSSRSSASNSHNKVDIRSVIAGVICGVAMLFVEMLLFVIRSHEFDANMRKKSKKKKPNPFGETRRPKKSQTKPIKSE